ncbi:MULTISPECIES: aminoglycoside phosphotransferase family protein [unclassified Agrobacterium]|uniref:aminoglycoside phosphotransferase family protein n=1 Tax=unclassified Agrobacterium TaxID=2632611 RepID=UPI00244A6771|nr:MULTISPECIES: aminoglycoside phosphotransferase family protein [unclassified Agrobacterium]MDH0613842.1 aminoglycoside phosphotransferase family protein [Agrobacterium sp. GD03872]MDH0696731.1 aminoglycoside phosphotransferase family protein [Agrobacterium sp. GD03871]MDH1060105.1 aminoglycoside phosphotransferase family protein [Agrobacterium sp. GD03992]MDH2210018.1 aminoglycoside phosphotransferase family protein [Agrobacterium sp. GD03643]MDH2219517.1 aminoglycoside phosphotransferase f
MDDRIVVSTEQVRALIASQFPQWAHLNVRPVELSGWDNRSFRLGDGMLVRMPSASRYVAQVEKEHRWLPLLAPFLPCSIPEPLALGQPGEAYPFSWSIYRWLEGEPLARHPGSVDLSAIAIDVASFLKTLHGIDASEGPPAGAHNFHRGGSLAVYDGEARASAARLTDEVDQALAMEIWQLALSSHWREQGVWVHGDIAEGNLLVKDGRLSAVIDFGSSGVGDPSSDLILAWNVLDAESRAVFRRVLDLDEATWQRGRGWALWKALIVLDAERGRNDKMAEWSRRTIREVFADHLGN